MILNVRSRIREWLENIEASGDPRAAKWLLVKSPLPIVSFIVAYFLVVVYGPRIMQNRKPLQLKKILYVYNAFQVVLSTYMFAEGTLAAWESGHNFQCQKVDYSDNPVAVRIAQVSWWYFFSKFVDLLDTVFFILRKKNSQVTVLHVYHHSTMVVMTWLCIKYAPGGQAMVTGLLNSFVHVIMYSYYFLSTLGPRVQPYLWWKKYLTQLQLAQFVIILAHGWYGVFIQCEFPKILVFFMMFYPLTMLGLFGNFYVQSYIQKRNKQK